jgi:hypothetical protein
VGVAVGSIVAVAVGSGVGVGGRGVKVAVAVDVGLGSKVALGGGNVAVAGKVVGRGVGEEQPAMVATIIKIMNSERVRANLFDIKINLLLHLQGTSRNFTSIYCFL